MAPSQILQAQALELEHSFILSVEYPLLVM